MTVEILVNHYDISYIRKIIVPWLKETMGTEGSFKYRWPNKYFSFADPVDSVVFMLKFGGSIIDISKIPSNRSI